MITMTSLDDYLRKVDKHISNIKHFKRQIDLLMYYQGLEPEQEHFYLNKLQEVYNKMKYSIPTNYEYLEWEEKVCANLYMYLEEQFKEGDNYE